jgi:hypothetical protein
VSFVLQLDHATDFERGFCNLMDLCTDFESVFRNWVGQCMKFFFREQNRMFCLLSSGLGTLRSRPTTQNSHAKMFVVLFVWVGIKGLCDHHPPKIQLVFDIAFLQPQLLLDIEDLCVKEKASKCEISYSYSLMKSNLQ